jgi:hypothetical protein
MASASDLKFPDIFYPIKVDMSKICDGSTAVPLPSARQEDVVNFLDPALTAMALIASNCE